jgi:2-methylcitrate dehydratase PrpD
MFEALPVTDDGLLAAKRAKPGEQLQRDLGHPGWVLFSVWQCDKKNHGWREGRAADRGCQVSIW